MPRRKLPRCDTRTDPRVRRDTICACRGTRRSISHPIGRLVPALAAPHRSPALALAIDPARPPHDGTPRHAPDRRRQLYPGRRDPAMGHRDKRDRLEHANSGNCWRRLANRHRERRTRSKRDVAGATIDHGGRPPDPSRRRNQLRNAGVVTNTGHSHGNRDPVKGRRFKSYVVDADLHGTWLLPVTCQ